MAVSTNFSAKPAITHYLRLGSGLLDRRPVTLVQAQGGAFSQVAKVTVREFSLD